MTSDKLFDVRLLDRNLQKGLITREEYDKHVGALDDAEDKGTAIEAEFVVGVLDDDDAQGEEE